ncbi:MAG TPA: hypothetical protein DD738_00910 [Ruminiclostridium sp.]|nr:hypothetical protein [Ruminiclostridium sp.]
MKKLRIDTIVFIIAITVLGIANLLNFNKAGVSKLENRTLKPKPQFSAAEFLKGSYTQDYEDYFSDTFILRDSMVRLSRDVQHAMRFLGPDVSLITTIDDLPTQKGNETGEKNQQHDEDKPQETDSQNSQEPADSTQTPTPKPSQPAKTDFGDDPNVGYWLVVDGKAVQLFKFNKESFEYYAQVLNKFGQKLGSDVKLYSMIPPTNGEFLRLKKYKGITDSQNDALDFLNSKLDDSISSVNVYDALNSHTDEYIYFRTDHHWTALGAYYAYASWMESTGRQPTALEDFETIDIGDFLGSSYTKTLDESLKKNPDHIIAYKPFTGYEYLMYDNGREKKADIIDMQYANEITDKYLAFMSSGGANWSVVKTDVHNGKKIMVVKDSFGNAFVPFLLPHYEEIYVVDPRFYNVSTTGNIVDFVREKGINEVVFCIYMEDVNWHKFMGSVEHLLGE